MWEFISRMLASDFMPHGRCWAWDPWVVWTNVASDFVIALAYTLISLNLIYLIRRRKDVSFSWMVALFGTFIFACGMTHAMEVYNTWHGLFRLAGVVKFFTAVVSIGTALLLLRLTPALLGLPALEEVRSINATLEAEVQERRQVEQSLREANLQLQQAYQDLEALRVAQGERFELMFENSLDVVFLTGEAGLIRYASQSTTRVLGHAPADLMDRPWFEALHAADWDRARERFQEALGQPGVPLSLECRARHLNGEWRTLDCICLNRLDEPRIGAVMITARDITKRKQAQEALVRRTEELARSNADLERFAYVASHDLQEPLRMVSSFTQLLARRYEGRLDAEADEFIRYAVGGTQTMQALIRDLLAYAQVGSRGQAFAPTPLGDAVEEARKLLMVALQETQATLEVAELPTLDVDPGQMVQLFQNLIGNALKFRSDRPLVIQIGARREAEGWTIWVRDNGIGLDPKFKDRIFVIFQRLHARDEYPGTGIGLSICKRILERHGGTIWVESVPGEGCTFLFRLPDPSAGTQPWRLEALHG